MSVSSLSPLYLKSMLVSYMYTPTFTKDSGGKYRKKLIWFNLKWKRFFLKTKSSLAALGLTFQIFQYTTI